MTTFTHLLAADWRKIRRTAFLPVHLGIPLLGALVFGLYSAVTPYGAASLAGAYFTLLAVLYPVVAALTSATLFAPEIGAGGGYFLVSSPARGRVLGAKLLYLLGFGLLSCLLATGGYGALCHLMGKGEVPLALYLQAGVILWLSSLFLYVLHTWLDLRFGQNISFGVAAVELLLAALFRTGLGNGIWYAAPFSWGVRFLSMWFSGAVGGEAIAPAALHRELSLGGGFTLGITLAAILLLTLWFFHWEGRRDET